MDDKLVTVASFAHSFQAQFAKEALEEEGINCFLAATHAHSLWGDGATIQNIDLQVKEADKDRALKIVEAVLQSGSDESAKDEREEGNGLQ